MAAPDQSEIQVLQKGINLKIEKVQCEPNEETGDVSFLNYFAIENKLLTNVNVEIDFTGSEDITIENKDEKDFSQKVNMVIHGESVETVASVKINLTSNLVWAINWQQEQPEEEKIKESIEKANQGVNSYAERSKKLFKNFPLAESSLKDIEQQLFEHTLKFFVDPEFTPSNDKVSSDDVHWRRPVDFMDLDNPIEVFHKDIEARDIKAGPRSLRWLLCAISTLSERPELVKKLFLTQEYKENGAYRMQINKSGVWQELTIDDFMPCQLEGSPLYTRTNGNELWVQLLEKAYAKLHNGYKNLEKGFHANEALQDFTGFPVSVIDLGDRQLNNLKSEDLFKVFEHYFDEGYLMSASAPGLIGDVNNQDMSKVPNALVAGHTYSILKVKTVFSHKLIQIRNNWGFFNWDGAWSKKSHFWTQDIQKVLKPELTKDDGTFWMSWDDFTQHFAQINVCKTRESHEVRVKGQYLRLKGEDEEESDRIVSKWFYCLDLVESANLHLGLHQVDNKIKGDRTYLDSGFVILKRTQEGTDIEVSQEFIVNSRDTELDTVLERGQYVILPQTNGVDLKPHGDAEEVKVIDNGALSSEAEVAIEDIFYRFDTMISNSLDENEFNDLWEQLGNEKKTAQDFKDKVLTHCSTDRGLTCKGLKSFLAVHFSEVGEEEAHKQLANIGFSANLKNSFSRSFIMSVHSDKPIEIQIGDAVSTNLDDAALILNMEKNGHAKISKPEVTLLQTPQDSQSDSYTFGAKNMCTVPLEVTFNVSNCKNCLYSSNDAVVSKLLEPGQTEFLMHVRRDDLEQELIMNHEFSVKEQE